MKTVDLDPHDQLRIERAAEQADVALPGTISETETDDEQTLKRAVRTASAALGRFALASGLGEQASWAALAVEERRAEIAGPRAREPVDQYGLESVEADLAAAGKRAEADLAAAGKRAVELQHGPLAKELAAERADEGAVCLECHGSGFKLPTAQVARGRNAS